MNSWKKEKSIPDDHKVNHPLWDKMEYLNHLLFFDKYQISSISNGIVWSLDAKKMYYIDTPERLIRVFIYQPEKGIIIDTSHIIDLSNEEGVPDGMTIDSKGNLWVAMWDGSQILEINPNSNNFNAPSSRLLLLVSCTISLSLIKTSIFSIHFFELPSSTKKPVSLS